MSIRVFVAGALPLVGGCVPFEVTDVSLPDTITSDAEREALSVSWNGEPVFPVEVVYQPRVNGCPAGVACATERMTFEQSANPLVFPEAVWCERLTTEVFFDYEVVLADAEGRESAPFAAGVTCVP